MSVRWEYDLLALPSTKRALLFRTDPSHDWRQVGVFDSYNDAQRVLWALRRDAKASA